MEREVNSKSEVIFTKEFYDIIGKWNMVSSSLEEWYYEFSQEIQLEYYLVMKRNTKHSGLAQRIVEIYERKINA